MNHDKEVEISSILLITTDPALAKETSEKQKVVKWVKSLPEAIAYLAKFHDANTIFLDASTLEERVTAKTVEVLLLPYVPKAKVVYFCRSLYELSALELNHEALFKMIEARA